MKLYLIAGEASGDARGAEVMEGLATLFAERGEPVTFHGAGGPKMKALAPEIDNWSEEAGVVGLWDVLKKYGYFRRKFAAMLAEVTAWQPDAVVFIDYPGFNLRLAKALDQARRRTGRGPQLIYYISPQVWAWNRRRIPKMARMLDLMLCIFPFEKALYASSGLETVFVGHPMLDTLARARLENTERESGLVGLFPGSRSKEVTRIFPVMAAAARQMHTARPTLRFEAAAASAPLAETMRTLAREAGWEEGALTITTGLSHSLMQRAQVGMVASGTATVESAYFAMPFVLVYRVAPLTWAVGKRLVRVPFLGMVNLLAGREVVPEFLQSAATPEAVASGLFALLDDPARCETQVTHFAEVITALGDGGAGLRAAGEIEAHLRTVLG